MREHIIGVSVSAITVEHEMAIITVRANSLKFLPTTPPIKTRGIKTMIRAILVDITAPVISPMLSMAALKGFLPSSICLVVFSRTTIASSTRKPTESVRAIRDRLSKLKCLVSMTAKVAHSVRGRTIAGMMVSFNLPRKRKITRITKIRAMTIVVFTSFIDSRIVSDLSYRISTLTDPGISSLSFAKVSRTFFERATVLAPAALEIATTTTPDCIGSSGFGEYITFILSFWSESMLPPKSLILTGAPSTYFMISSS